MGWIERAGSTGVSLLVVALAVSLVSLAGCGGGGAGTFVSGGAITNGLLLSVDLFQLGETARSQGNLSEALVLYQRVIDEFPGDPFVDDALVGKGDVLLARSDFLGARESYRQAAARRGDRLGDAMLAIGKASVAEFEALDGGTLGFVDATAAGEFLANLEAIEAFRIAADATELTVEQRLLARQELGTALFRGRRFSEARDELDRVIATSSDSLVKRRAQIQKGLAFVEEGNSAGAVSAFRDAGAQGAGSAPLVSESARPVLGGFAGPSVGFVSLSDLVIVVSRAADSAKTGQELSDQAELGICITLAQVVKDLPESIRCLELLVARRLPAPVGDLARFQLGEVRRNNNDPDGALGDYQALLADYPASAFAQRAHQRIGEILFDVFSQESQTRDVVDSRIVANLETTLRRAVGDSPDPIRDSRRRALNLLGRLDSEGIPLPLTIAMPSGLPRGFAGAPYQASLVAFGGTGKVTWSLATGTILPAGLSLTAAGQIGGTPLEPARSFVTLTARDDAGATDTRPFPITIEPFQILAPNLLVDGIVGQPYRFQIQARGVEPFAYELVQATRVRNDGRPADVAGGVPGITLSTAGLLAGTPTTSSGSSPLLLAIRARDGKARQQVFFVKFFVVDPWVLAKPSHTGDLPQPLPSAGSRQGDSGSAFSAVGIASAAPSFLLTTVPPRGHEVVITPDGKSAVVIHGFFTEGITVIDLATGASRSAPLPPPLVFGKFPFSLDVSPDSRLALVGEFSNLLGQMHVIDLATLKAIHTVDSGARTQAVEFTPDGLTAVSRSAEKVVSLDLASLTTRSVSIADVGSGRSLAILPDSRRVLVAGELQSNLATLIDLASGSRTTFTLSVGAVFARALPGGQQILLSATTGNRLLLLDLETGTVETLLVGNGAETFALSRDGAAAAVVSLGDQELALIDLADRRVRRIRSATASLGSPIAITPEGQTVIAFDGEGGSAFLVDTRSLDIRTVEGFGAIGSQSRNRTAVSSDGSFVLSFAGEFPISTVNRLVLAEAPIRVGLVRKPLPGAVVGQPYSHQFEAQGGQGPYTFGSPSLVRPIPGLTLSPGGELSGTPAVPGLFNLQASVRDSLGATAAFSVPWLVREPDQSPTPLTLATRRLAKATVGIDYRQSLAAVGGQPSYQYSVAEGSLPTGIGLSASGLLGGTALQTTTAVFVVAVSDRRSDTSTHEFTLQVERELPVETSPSVIVLLAPPLDLLALDLNADGRQDLAVGHQSATTNLSVYLAGISGTLELPATVAVRDLGQPGSLPAGSVQQLASADFNGDGNQDLSVRASPGLGNRFPPFIRPAVVPFLGDGQGGLTLVAAPDIPQFLVSHVSGDVNRDGKDDIVATSFLNNPGIGVFATTYVQLSNGDGTFSEQGPVITSSPLQILQYPVLGDLSGDSKLDLVASVFTDVNTPRTVRVFAGDGLGHFDFAAPSIVMAARTTQSVFSGIVLEDLDSNGRQDIVVREEANILFSLSDSSGRFGPKTVLFQSPEAGDPVVADIDGNGTLDVIVPVRAASPATARDGRIAILPGLGDGTFDSPIFVTGDLSPGRSVVADVTGDKLHDLCVLDTAENQLMIFKGRRTR